MGPTPRLVAVLDAVPMFRWRGQYKRYKPQATSVSRWLMVPVWGSWYYVYRPSFISVSHEELGA